MGALAVDVTKYRNTKSVSADSTITFSATASSGAFFGLHLTNSDSAGHIITIPSSFSMLRNATITALTIPASSQLWLVWHYDGTTYRVWGDPGANGLNNFGASTNPGVGDDSVDGYGPGSLWVNTTTPAAFVCITAGAGAADWNQIDAAGGGGDASTNTASSVDSEVAIFSGTAGKTLKRATGTGFASLTSGVLSVTNAASFTSGTATGITSFGLRNAGTGAFDMTHAHNGTLTAGRTLTWNLNDAARTVSLAGNLTLAGTLTTAAAFTQAGAFATTITATATSNFTLPAGTQTGAALGLAQSYTAAQRVTSVALTDGATINTDAALSNKFRVTLGGNRTLANPTNLADGQPAQWRVIQDATGSRTLAYGSAFKWPGGTAPTLTTAANAVDLICCEYDSTSATLMCNIVKDIK